MGSRLRLIIDPEAQKEINNAIDWYESTKEGLGKNFYTYLDGYFKTLIIGNVLFLIKRKPAYRELSLKRFLLIITYEQTDREIYVFSVFNTNQDPAKKNNPSSTLGHFFWDLMTAFIVQTLFAISLFAS